MLMCFGLAVVALLLLIALLVWSDFRTKSYFEKQGIPYLGNRTYGILYNSTIGNESVVDHMNKWFKRMRQLNASVGGSTEFGKPVFNVIDPDLLKQICIKDFDCFVNRREYDMPQTEILFDKMLFMLRGDKWKSFRSKVTPAFTSGKIKRLYHVFQQSSQQLVSYIDNQLLPVGDSGLRTGEIEFQDAFGKFTVEIIANAVCGIQSKSFDPSANHIFEKMARRLEIRFSPGQILNLLIILLFPRLATMLNMSFFDKEAQEYFLWSISQTVRVREQNPDKAWDDFIQLMLEVKRGTLTNDDTKTENSNSNSAGEGQQEDNVFDDATIAANSVLFILAGFETTLSFVLFAVYEIALNPDIQERLRKEIEDVVDAEREKGVDNFLSFEAMHGLEYLDMFVNETFRKYPPTVLVDRGCTQDYKIPGTNVTVKKGEGILIPVYTVHHDERWFPEPEKFDPERFSKENKGNIHPNSFIPFGSGPRGCIGYRFALTEAKLAVATIVYNYMLEPSSKTLIPMVFENYNLLRPKNGMNLQVTKIHRSSPNK